MTDEHKGPNFTPGLTRDQQWDLVLQKYKRLVEEQVFTIERYGLEITRLRKEDSRKERTIKNLREAKKGLWVGYLAFTVLGVFIGLIISPLLFWLLSGPIY